MPTEAGTIVAVYSRDWSSKTFCGKVLEHHEIFWYGFPQEGWMRTDAYATFYTGYRCSLGRSIDLDGVDRFDTTRITIMCMDCVLKNGLEW